MKEIKETISRKLLKLLEGGLASTIDIAWAMSADKSTSYKRIKFIRDNPSNSPGNKFVRDVENDYDEYKRYHAILSKLKKEGLVEVEGTYGSKFWKITGKGSSFLNQHKNQMTREDLITSDGVTIISYDIPETRRRERNRVRELLKLIGFEQAHQSLWFANKKITKHFLDILRERNILQYVHIFEINKMGTLKKIDEKSGKTK